MTYCCQKINFLRVSFNSRNSYVIKVSAKIWLVVTHGLLGARVEPGRQKKSKYSFNFGMSQLRLLKCSEHTQCTAQVEIHPKMKTDPFYYEKHEDWINSGTLDTIAYVTHLPSISRYSVSESSTKSGEIQSWISFCKGNTQIRNENFLKQIASLSINEFLK